MIKSPLRYPGGKSRAVDLITKILPDFQEFREPFVGGGSIFIHLKQMFPKRKFWINDLYTELYKFWQVSQTDLRNVVSQVETWKAEFQNGKELHKFLAENIASFDDLQTASAFFVFNRITFSGTTEAGGFSQQAFEKRFTDSSIWRLRQLENVLENVKITNFDYQTVVEAEGENVLIYLDPPYFSATKSALYGKNGKLHKAFDHLRFADTLKNCPHKWLITYDDCEFIRELFSFAEITPWSLMYGMRNQTATSDQHGKELFISNFEIAAVKSKTQIAQASLFA